MKKNCRWKTRFIMMIALTIVGCASFKKPIPINDHVLFSLIKKSSESCDKFSRIEGKYYREISKNQRQILVSTGIQAEYNYMYLIKRTPESVSRLLKHEKFELKTLLKAKNNFSLAEKDWFSQKNDFIIPIYSNIPQVAFD